MKRYQAHKVLLHYSLVIKDRDVSEHTLVSVSHVRALDVLQSQSPSERAGWLI